MLLQRDIRSLMKERIRVYWKWVSIEIELKELNLFSKAENSGKENNIFLLFDLIKI